MMAKLTMVLTVLLTAVHKSPNNDIEQTDHLTERWKYRMKDRQMAEQKDRLSVWMIA